MSDSYVSRVGLSNFGSSRANVIAVPAAKSEAQKPSDGSEVRPRLSGGKRDIDNAQASDPIQNAATTEPPKKKKITYILPHQNMEQGHFYVVLGEDIDVSTCRFKILSLLGSGTFGKVVEAWDRKRKEYCAVKIVRNVPKYTKDATYEIQFMERVRRHDPEDRFPLMKIERHFQNETGHMCIVMHKYGPCLLDWIQKHGPFSHRALAEIVFQAGCALDFFHSEMRLIHTDLKPENLLLESSTPATDPVTGKSVPTLPCKIRICDLGGCCDEKHSKNAIVSTRHYRSPEVILGLGWMFSTDLWSMGCIIFELATGKLLYDTHDNLEHLHLMEKSIGKLPMEFLTRATGEGAVCYSQSSQSLRPCTDAKHIARIARARPIRELIADDLLRDLILGLLNYDRSKRTTARALSTHPYVLKYFPESLHSPIHPNNRRLSPVPLN